MSTHNIVYNTLILAAFILSLIASLKGYKRFGLLSLLLFITSVLELSVLYLIEKETDFTWLYHIYNVVEYALLCLFLADAINSAAIAKVIKVSIPLFILTGLSVSYFYYSFSGFPGLNINIEGLLLSIICVYILFNMEVIEKASIFSNYYFWICSGILIFFGTTFFFNGIYTRIAKIDGDRALILFSTINRPLNIILYSFIIIGILCLLMKKKPTTQ